LILTFTGWATNEDGDLSPFVASVRNLEPEPSFARMPEFKWARRPNVTSAGWVAEGQPLSQRVRAKLQRRLAKGLNAGISAEVVMDLFLQEVKVVGVMIGIDPHKASHTAVALDGSESMLGQVRIRASKAFCHGGGRDGCNAQPLVRATQQENGIPATKANHLVMPARDRRIDARADDPSSLSPAALRALGVARSPRVSRL
jgi:hypothetical protein